MAATMERLFHLKVAVTYKAEWCVQVGADLGVVMRMPEIEYRSNTKAAGVAFYREHKIMINEQLLVEYPREQIEETVPHEIAHLFTHMLFPRSAPHGFVWSEIMSQWFRVEPKRMHRMDVSNCGRGKGTDIDLESLFTLTKGNLK